jgi:chaperonin GroES
VRRKRRRTKEAITMATKIRPLGDKVLIKRMDAADRTDSGLYLPESAKEKPQQAKVISVGHGRELKDGKRAPFQIKKGDTVLIGKWGGTEVKVEDDEMLIIAEDEILGIVN